MRKTVFGLVLLASTSAWAATPIPIQNSTFNLSGKFKVKASGKCYGRRVSVSKASPAIPTATVSFDAADEIGNVPYTWVDGGSAINQTGEAIADEKINRYDLVWSENNASALFHMAGIPDTGTSNGVVSFENYTFAAKVSKSKKTAKLSAEESVLARLETGICSFQWKITRSLSGLATAPLAP